VNLSSVRPSFNTASLRGLKVPNPGFPFPFSLLLSGSLDAAHLVELVAADEELLREATTKAEVGKWRLHRLARRKVVLQMAFGFIMMAIVCSLLYDDVVQYVVVLQTTQSKNLFVRTT